MQVFGRGPQVLRVIQVLARRTKSNPILLGQPGVGKTAIAGEASLSFLVKVSPSLKARTSAARFLKPLALQTDAWWRSGIACPEQAQAQRREQLQSCLQFPPVLTSSCTQHLLHCWSTLTKCRLGTQSRR